MDDLVEFKDVSKTFFSEKGETIVLSHVSFSLKPHEIIAIIGPSGCGKSTLLNLVSGLIEPSEGYVTLNARMGYMFQTDHLFSWRTVKDIRKISIRGIFTSLPTRIIGWYASKSGFNSYFGIKTGSSSFR